MRITMIFKRKISIKRGMEITSLAIERGGRRQGVPAEIAKSVKAALKSGGEVAVGIEGEGVVAAAPMAVDGDSKAVPEL